MSIAFYKEFEFTELVDIKSPKDSITPVQEAVIVEMKEFGVDRIHFSDNFPAVLFKEVISFNEIELQKIAEIHHKVWNYKKVLFLYVSSPTEIRIYNCAHNPFNYLNKKLNLERELDLIEITSCRLDNKRKLEELKSVFSSIAIDSGFIWTRDNEYINKIDIKRRIDRYLVSSLLNTGERLKELGLETKVVHSLIMRSLFVMYLEDRKATPKNFYSDEKKDAASYLDLLDDCNATYSFFEKIKSHFNGNVFPVSKEEKEQITQTHLNIIKNCLINGTPNNDQLLLFEWRIFNFGIIQVELLSEIYENFLADLDNKDKKKSGAFYTPPALVELILNEVLPVNKNESNYNLKIIDPACGSGIFLVEAYKRIVTRWKNANPKAKINFNKLSELLQNSIYGVEIDPKAIKVSAFSLYLAMLDFLDPKNLWYIEGEVFPYLIHDNEDSELIKQGKNLYRTNTILENGEFENRDYDIVIGNPPFGAEKLDNYIKDYCERNNFSKQFIIPFIHKSTRLSPNGKIALVINSKILTNTELPARNFRNWLFKESYVEKVFNLSILRNAPKTFGGKLFDSVSVPVSIIFFQREIPDTPVQTIEYWAPKTYIKNHVADGVMIDSSDIKYLPREECQKSDSKIWKITHWGMLSDYYLLSKLQNNDNNIKFEDFIKKNKIKKGVGFQLLSESKTKPRRSEYISKLPYLKASSIERYYTNHNNFSHINDSLADAREKTILFYLDYYDKTNIRDLPSINDFRRKGTVESYNSPHLVLKKGLTNGVQICASYLNKECSFKDGVYGFYSERKDSDTLKYLSALFCSKYAHYFLFLVASSYAVEREQIFLNEYLQITTPQLSDKEKEDIVSLFDQVINQKNKFFESTTIESIQKEIDSLFYKHFKLSLNEQVQIEDVFEYSIDLFHKGEKSIALKPISAEKPETIIYAEFLCKELNVFLRDGATKVNATIYKNQSPYSPLCLVVLNFENSKKSRDVVVLNSDNDYQKQLKELNKYTLKEYSRNIYVQKQIRHYDENQIFILKPNQKRFWSRSQAIDDAQSIIIEILKMDVKNEL